MDKAYNFHRIYVFILKSSKAAAPFSHVREPAAEMTPVMRAILVAQMLRQYMADRAANLIATYGRIPCADPEESNGI